MVATARNDNHGGNLLGRMQVFVDAWINQCKRHNLSSELILVEWNPPAGKPKLAEALRWPADTGPCAVRIIEVPPELHRRYQFAETLPLYQMIAKNVGIRRARGEFILVTNIDVVCSNELFEFFASRQLKKGFLYRIDRTDAATHVPVDGSLDEQLAYCRDNVIRSCARDGIFKLTPEGFRQHESKDITRPDSGIWFGNGWHEIERYTIDLFRWMREEAELFLSVPAGGGVLTLNAEPGPGVGTPPQPLQALDGQGNLVAEWMVSGRTTLRLSVPPAVDGAVQRVVLRAPTGGLPVLDDTRIMNFRLFRCDWVDPDAPDDEGCSFGQAIATSYRTLARLAVRQGAGVLNPAFRLLRGRGADIFDAGAEFQIGGGWYYLEHAGGQRARWVVDEAELAVRFTDETASLALLLEPGPCINHQPFNLVVRSKSGEILADARIDGLTYVDLPLPVEQGQWMSVVLHMHGVRSSGPLHKAGDERTLNFRVYGCGRGSLRKPTLHELARAGAWNSRTVGFAPAEVDWPVKLKDVQREIAEMGKPEFLHLYACGDFQLMARENWDDVRGYAELDQFSMHLDSILSYTVHHMGVKEYYLADPMRVYHIEHDVGTGWTPEGYKELNQRLEKKGIQSITFPDLADMVAEMRFLHAPLIFNLDNWGMADCELPETTPVPSGVPVSS